MTVRFLLIVFLAVTVPLPKASAQAKFNGTLQCNPVDSRTEWVGPLRFNNHKFHLEEQQCEWREPVQIGSGVVKEETRTSFTEIKGKVYRERGSSEGTLTSGDKYYIRWRFEVSTVKDNYSVSRQVRGSWEFRRGTGELRGIRGAGKYVGEVVDGGDLTLNVQGQYRISK